MKRNSRKSNPLRFESLESREMFSVGGTSALLPVILPRPAAVNPPACIAMPATQLAPAAAAVQSLASRIAEPPDLSNSIANAKTIKFNKAGTAFISGSLPANDLDWVQFKATGKNIHVETTTSSQTTTTIVEIYTISHGKLRQVAAGDCIDFHTKPGQTYFMKIRPQWPGASIQKYTVSLISSP